MMVLIPKRNSPSSTMTAARSTGTSRSMTSLPMSLSPVARPSSSIMTPTKNSSAAASTSPAMPDEPNAPKNCHSS